LIGEVDGYTHIDGDRKPRWVRVRAYPAADPEKYDGFITVGLGWPGLKNAKTNVKLDPGEISELIDVLEEALEAIE